jgi:transcription initiation factor TFIIIB Brf1 subunit/transcription initiation factor TFIIB
VIKKMATNERLSRIKREVYSLDKEISTCDACDSTDIKQTREGYVCANCGLVLSSLVLEYHHPYNETVIQHAPRGGTQIGLYKERVTTPQSAQLQKWQKLDSERDREEDVKIKARSEIKRLLSGLGLPLSESQHIFKQFCAIRKVLQSGTKFRSPEKLVPITVYLHFKLNCKGINEQELLEISNITKKEFNAFKLQVKNFIPYYCKRNRKDYILQKILQITEEFGMDMEFYNTAKKIMYSFWEVIKNTKDDVIAGVVCSIVALCDKQKRLKVNAICSHLGIQMSTIQRQVELNVFHYLRVKGFKSLVKSSELLRKVMIKLGLIEKDERMPVVESLTVVNLGSGKKVFNPLKTFEYYMHVIKTTLGTFIILSKSPTHDKNEFPDLKKIIPLGTPGSEKITIKVQNYHYPKGPPLHLTSH